MRQSWIDRWKGILILLVVLGHVAGGGANISVKGSESILLLVRDIIYLFHMPAFFVLAGICWRDSDGWIRFLKRKSFRLLVPYIIFGVMSWVIYDAIYGTWGEFGFQMASLIHGGNCPNGEGFKCNSVLWFPPVMFVVLAGYRILESVVKSRAVLAKCCLCVLLWCLRVLCYRYRVLCLPWGIDLALWYLPYFIIGTMAGELIGMIKVRWLFVCSVLVFAAVSFLKFHMPPERLASFSGFSYAISLALSGTCITLSVAKARFWDVRQVSWCGARLAKIGVASMGIMLLHKFPVVALQERIGIIRSMFCGNGVEGVTGMMIVFVAATACSYYVSRILRLYMPSAIGEKRI